MIDHLKRARSWAAGLGLGLAACLATSLPAMAGMGQPSPKQMGLQEPATLVAAEINRFHDFVNVIIIAIAVFVLVLMVWVMLRFNEKANPTPSRFTHNATIEVLWTVIPVAILVLIAVPSFKLLYLQYDFPKPDLTIKATGYQWYWSHEYPDHGGIKFDSVMLQDDERAQRTKRGIDAPRLLSVDNEVVVPVDKVVHVLVTAADVIHNWTIPSFGSKTDAVPGRVTATWFKATKEGVFYGQCSELCGKDHAFMPIAVRVVKEAAFNEWVAAVRARDRRKAREIIEKAEVELKGASQLAAAQK
jgi:cytochrome c oxidase subunit 2